MKKSINHDSLYIFVIIIDLSLFQIGEIQLNIS